MKKLLTILFFLPLFTKAAIVNHYFSSTGSDANTGTSAGSPWQTIAKFNSTFSSLSPGDSVLFKKGDTFYGKIIISRSGSAGLPIIIGAYGTGNNPVITGFTDLVAWTNLGSNIWQSTFVFSTLATCNMVTINGVNTPMGRTPNTGSTYTWQTNVQGSAGTPSTITSSSLSGFPNWSGAEVAFQTTTYVISRDIINSQSGSTLTYTTPNPVDLFQAASTYFVRSFIIQNDPRTLDATNEWYYNPSAKKLSIYNTVSPTNVKASTIDTLVYMSGKSYILFDNISFEGANLSAMEMVGSSNHIVVQNCSFNFSGRNAFHGGVANSKVLSTTVNHTNNNGIDFDQGSSDTVRLCTVRNSAVIPFSQRFYTNAATAVRGVGSSFLAEYNIIDSCAYNGIRIFGSNTTVQNNYVTNYGITQYDGGGIYTWNGTYTPQSNIKIINNVTRLINGKFNNHGVYLDAGSNGILIQGNSCTEGERGIQLGDVFNVQVLNNTTYSTDVGVLIDKRTTGIASNITIKNNIFFAKTATQRPLFALTAPAAYVPTPFTSDSNYYCRPITNDIIQSSNGPFQTYFSGAFTQRILSGWQTLNAQDAHSKGSPKSISTTSDLRFEYNATSSPVTISLPGHYIDVRIQGYNGTITLQPYTSAVLTLSPLITPILTWADQTAVYGSSLAPTQNATSGGVPGTYSYNYSTTPTSGVYTDYTVTFTPTDPITYSSASKTVNLTISKIITVLSWSDQTAVSGASMAPTQTATSGGVPGTFAYNYTVTPSPGFYNNYTASFNPTDPANYTSPSIIVNLIITSPALIDPTITWSNQTVVYGTSMTPTQTATSGGVSGTFAYNYSVTPSVGVYTDYTVIFNPTDTGTYNSATKIVNLTVTQPINTNRKIIRHNGIILAK